MRTVMLTGAAGNLGRAVAAAFGDANRVLLDLKRGNLEESDRQMFIAADLLDAKSVQATVDQAVQWVAHWVKSNGRTLNKPSHFETRDGKF